MRNYHVRIVAGLIAGGWLACAAPTVRQYFVDQALDRAAFDLRCSKSEVEMVQVSTPLDQGMRPGAQVGVKGCGKQSVYVFVRNHGWTLDSASESEQAAK